jgi:NHL repeat
VAVEILDPRGRIVRHLGGAALGAKKPPPTPFQTGLSQSITWDGKDKTGKLVSGKNLLVRVRLGLKVNFDRFIGWKDTPPMNYSLINGLAVTKDRKVYVMSVSSDLPRAPRAENRLWVMSPEGKYIKTIYPYPASMDPAKLPGADFLSQEKNRLTPRIYDRVLVSSLPRMRGITRQTMAVTSDGRLIFTNGWGAELYGFGPRAMMMLNTDGTIPRKRIEGPILGKGKWAGYLHLALAPDEKSAYVCGLLSNSRYLYPKKARNVVYRMGLGIEDKPQVIFGKLGQALSGKEGLTLPRGIAVDSKGRVYVSDFGNDRIVVLDPDGKYLSEIPLKGPGVLSVHPKTDAIYAISMPGAKVKSPQKLVKILSLQKPEIVAEQALGSIRKTHTAYHPVIALDPYGEKPIVYIGIPSKYIKHKLMRIFDEGTGFKKEDIDLSIESDVPGFPYVIGTNSKGDLYFRSLSASISFAKHLNTKKYNAETGKIENVSKKVGSIIGKDGFFYNGKYQGKSLMRRDASGKVVPFSATGEWSEPYNTGRFYTNRNCVYAPESGDNIWALGSEKGKPFYIVNLGTDGKIKRKGVVRGLTGPSSLKVDSYGNIFVADGLNLAGQPYPPEIDAFAKQLRAKGTNKRRSSSEAVEDCYGQAYGSIFKFSAEGGEIRKLGKGEKSKPDERLLAAHSWRSKFAAKGLTGIYPRISPMSPPRGLEFSSCWCLYAMFDLDSHNRLFVPDAMQFCVRVLDANFNEIAKFGGYDSATSRAGKANLPGPEIPFGFPTYVHVGGDAAYVTDTAPCARRVVRVKLSYATEETCAIR